MNVGHGRFRAEGHRAVVITLRTQSGLSVRSFQKSGRRVKLTAQHFWQVAAAVDGTGVVVVRQLGLDGDQGRQILQLDHDVVHVGIVIRFSVNF